MPANATPASDAAVAAAARALSAQYWDLAEELRNAAVQLSVAVDARSSTPIVSIDRLVATMKAGMVLHYMAAGGTR
jgi:hypothetical protein